MVWHWNSGEFNDVRMKIDGVALGEGVSFYCTVWTPYHGGLLCAVRIGVTPWQWRPLREPLNICCGCGTCGKALAVNHSIAPPVTSFKACDGGLARWKGSSAQGAILCCRTVQMMMRVRRNKAACCRHTFYDALSRRGWVPVSGHAPR